MATKGRILFLIRDSALYGTASAVSRIATLVTFPVIVRHLTVEEFGLLDYLQATGSFLTIMFIFGQESAVSRYFYEYEDKKIRCQLISQSLVFRIAGLIIALPILWYCTTLFGEKIERVSNSITIARIILIQVPFLLLTNFSVSLLRITFSRYRYVFLSLGYSFFQAALWMGAIFILDLRVEGLMIASVIASALFAAIGIVMVREWLTFPCDFELLKEMLPYAIPYGFICCLEAATPIIERTLVGGSLGSESLGLYAAGAKVSMLFAIAAYAFQVAWNPFALALHKRPDSARTYNWVLKLFSIAVCLFALILTSVAEPLVVLLASERYAAASSVVFPLVMGSALGSIGWITEIGINFSRRTHFKLYGYALAIIVAAFSMTLLMPLFGLFGAALGMLAGNLAKTSALTIFAQKTYPIPWDYASVTLVVAETFGFGMVATFLGFLWGPTANAVVCGIGCLAIATTANFRLFSTDERKSIAELLRAAAKSIRA